MKNVLVIGAGRFGLYTTMELRNLGHAVMVIDQNEERINRILPYASDAEIGDSTDEEFMATLGISDYDLCIVAIGDNFLSSLETTFLLNDLGAEKIIARATKDTQEKFLLKNGASAVVFPEKEMGRMTAIRYSSDNISNTFKLKDSYSIVEAEVPSNWDNKKIGELDIRKKHNLNVLAIKTDDLHLDINVDTVLHEGETIYVLGKNEDIKAVFY